MFMMSFFKKIYIRTKKIESYGAVLRNFDDDFYVIFVSTRYGVGLIYKFLHYILCNIYNLNIYGTLNCVRRIGI